MATLQTIRNRGGLLVSIVIGLALVAFIVGDALSSGANIFNRSKNQIGEIAGEGISIIDYQNRINKNEEIAKMMTRSTSLNDEQQTMVRENTWQQIVMEKVMNQEYEELGLSVSGDELYDMLLGDNMNPAIRQMFGNADPSQIRAYVQSLMSQPASNPEKAYWLNLEEQMTTSRLQNKYNNLLNKGLYTTDAQAEELLKNNATKTDFSYIVKNYSSIEDSTIQISNEEIKNYYNSHGKLFEQPESRRIVYVNFDVDPSGEDYAETEKWIKNLINEFAESENAAEFVDLSSDRKFDNRYYSRKEISNDSLADFLFNNKNSVYGPYIENNIYRISKVASTRMLPDSVRARHILLSAENTDYAHLKNLADSLANLLRKGADFEALAKQYSADPNTAVNGGDLGWFRPENMTHFYPLSDSVFFSNPREIKVVFSQYGAHITQLTDRGKPVEKIQIATVEKEVIPSQKTTNSIYSQARAFASNLKTLDDLNKKAEESNVTKRIATVNKNDRTIAGMTNARELIRQSYLASNTGNVILSHEDSPIFDTGDKYTIAVLTDINEEGIAPLNASVSNTIRRELIKKKKADLLKKELENAVSNSQSLLSVAEKSGGLEVKEATDITFNSFQIPGAGIEPKVIATAVLMEEGQISAPIEGNQGVYVLVVNQKTTDEIAPDQLEQTKKTLEQSNMYRANYQATQALLKNAEIKDTRYKFY